MMFYLSNVAIAINISQSSVRIGGGLHALIHIFFYKGGLKAPNHFGTLTTINVISNKKSGLFDEGTTAQ